MPRCQELVASQARYWDRKAPLRPPAELATLPSPRTAWTAGRWTLANWCRRHMAHAARSRRYRAGEARLALVGDSILEQLEINASFANALDRLPAEWRRPLHLAIGGDQTQHCLWRLRDGELSASMAADAALVYVVHVGTNNIGNYMGPGPTHSPAETHDGVMGLVRYLLGAAKGRVLLTAILPRTDAPRQWLTGEWLCPAGGCDAPGPAARPRTFARAIDDANARIAASAVELAREHPRRLAYADCGRAVWARPELVPDGVHPGLDGMTAFFTCALHAMRRAGFLTQ